MRLDTTESDFYQTDRYASCQKDNIAHRRQPYVNDKDSQVISQDIFEKKVKLQVKVTRSQGCIQYVMS